MTSQEQPSTCICGKEDCQIPYGFCHCKCGGKTVVAYKTCKTAKAGEPQRFIVGHQTGIHFPVDDAQPFKIDGKYCRFIPLGNGLIAIVSQERHAQLAALKWGAVWHRHTFYARRHWRENGKRKTICMHQMVLRVGDQEQCDHANGNGLDNRDDNLRSASDSQQRWNSKIRVTNTSGCTGVNWDEKTQKWAVRITVHRKEIWLGRHAEYEKAVSVRKEAEGKYFGGFVRIP